MVNVLLQSDATAKGVHRIVADLVNEMNDFEFRHDTFHNRCKYKYLCDKLTMFVNEYLVNDKESYYEAKRYIYSNLKKLCAGDGLYPFPQI